MAEDNKSKLPDIVSGGKKLWDLWSGYSAAETMATAGASQGMLYPGGISGAVPSAFQGGLSALSAAPFLGIAGFVAPKILQSMFGEKPRITFSGTDPKYMIPNAQDSTAVYAEYPGKAGEKGVKSQKYDYLISASDTGQDDEIINALIQQYDAIFDEMAASGVPVDELLSRNQSFISTGRVDKGMSPEQMLADVMTHFEPDISAYQSGKAPEAKEISVKPAGVSDRDDYDMGKIPEPYSVIIGADGATIPSANDQTIPGGDLSNEDQAIMGDTGGDTVADTSPIRDLYIELFDRPQPDKEGLDFWEGLWDTGEYTEDRIRAMMEGERANWDKSPGGTRWINNETGNEVLDVNGLPTAPDATIPDNIPDTLQPGFENFVDDSWGITNQYRDTADQLWSDYKGFESDFTDRFDSNTAEFDTGYNEGMARADQLWDDYLQFEQTFFGKYQDNQDQYQNNLAGMPQINLQMPYTMGGATVPLAPKVHSAMYTDQFNAMNSGIGQQANSSLAGLSSRDALNKYLLAANQDMYNSKNSATSNLANTQLAGMGSRDALAKNIFATNLANLQNSFLPTQAGMDLYQMERAGQLGIDRAEAGRYEPSTLSTWAPVVGGFLQSDWGGSAVEGLWDFGSDFVTSAWDELPF